MPTKRQHYVPRVYMKAWETQVETVKEPDKKFNGVYVFEEPNKGDGCNRNSVLWKPHLYTINFQQFYICNSCLKVKKDFVEKIYDLMRVSPVKPFYAKKGFSIIKTKRSIEKHFFEIYDWDFFYDNGDVARKASIIKQIEGLNCYILEDSFDVFFEKKWEHTLSEFVQAVKAGKPKGIGQSERIIPQEIAMDMLESFFIMLCRNPQFDAMGVYTQIKERLLYPVFSAMESDLVDERGKESNSQEGKLCADELIQGIWYSELYKMFYKTSGGFFHRIMDLALTGCQMILFETYRDSGSFITSDNPAFENKSFVEISNTNGFIFPLSPDYLLFICRGADGINTVDYRMANTDTIKHFNGIIFRNRNEKIITNAKDLNCVL